jgi:aerobic carbon-monoxide dehydrogenase large subunit
MNDIAMPKFGIGAPIRRREDAALITGHGRYTGDIAPEGALHAIVVRSQVAHARIAVAGLDEVRGAPGVRLVWTGEDIADFGGLPCKVLPRRADGSRVPGPEHPLLARGIVRHVGDPIAFIVADTALDARDASELLQVDYDTLDAVTDTARALDPDAPLVWPDSGSNLAFEKSGGDAGAVDAAFARADRVVSLTLVNNRVVANYMETRAAIGEFDPGTGRYTLTTGTQGGHSVRDIIARDILRIDPARLRVVTPDVGGGFGTKSFVYGEYPLVLKAAEALGRPVKWVQERSEHFQIDSHGRDNVTRAELAVDADGRFLALRIDLIAAMGAYLHQYGPDIPRGGLTMSTGLYDIPALYTHLRGVYTHTVPVDAYRGAGRPEAAFVIERLVDHAARELGMDPVDLRIRNFIRPDQLPYRTPTGRNYDTGDFAGHLRRAVEVADIKGFPARRAASVDAGKWRGIGIASYVEACAFPGSEEANVVLNRDGTATLFIGTQTNGQGHATAYGQLIASYLGIDLASVETVQGDTDRVARGEGTGGSRSIPLGLASVDIASKVLVKQIRELAADRLEASPADIELVDGQVRVVGTDKTIPLADIAATAPTESLKAYGNFQQDECTYPNGTHICEVEIDPDTGETAVLRYTVVDDFGVTVNPMMLAGQVHGGVVQSIGQALLERTVYDDSGQLLTATFLDYTMPRADDVPSFHFETHNIPSTTNLLGIKGAGEAGTVGATPAVMNAVVDALDHAAGIRQVDMPATPARLWSVINGG